MHSEASKYVAFVFDLDGTLVDSRPAIEKAAQAAVAEVLPAFCGRPVTTVIGPPIRRMFRLALGAPDEATLDRLVATFRQVYDSGVCRETTTYPGVVQLLAAIGARGASSFVLTNKPYNPTQQILVHLGCAQHLREIVTPDCPAHPFKAKAEALAALLQRHTLAPEATIMVGDSIDDASAAETCGVPFAAAVYGYGGLQPPHPNNWLTIHCVDDMLTLLD